VLINGAWGLGENVVQGLILEILLMRYRKCKPR
jgi:hypothetical protein